jgi:hypothetical protein
MAIRIARGYEKIHHPYQELYEGVRPSIQGLRAAKFLPISMLDKLHDDDPIVLLPGTFVGRLNDTGQFDATNLFTTAEVGARALTPACWGKYTVQYTSKDSDFGTHNIDDATAAGAAVNADGTDEGASTMLVQNIKPIGVLTAPVYSEVLKSKYTNYKRDLMPSILMGNYSIVMPAITTAELDIEPGDIVRVAGDGTSTGNHKATNKAYNVAAITPGRLTTWDGATASANYVVGRCIDKYKIAGGGGSGTRLSAKLAAGTTLTNLNSDHQFNTLKKVQTVPGLGLSGSGTQGIPAMFEHAVSDSAGDYFALVIKVDL